MAQSVKHCYLPGCKHLGCCGIAKVTGSADNCIYTNDFIVYFFRVLTLCNLYIIFLKLKKESTTEGETQILTDTEAERMLQ